MIIRRFLPELNLQLHSEEEPTPAVDEPIDEEDLHLIDDDLEEDDLGEDDGLDDDFEGELDDDDLGEDLEDDDVDDVENRPKFDREQQRELDRIVKARLERQEAKLLKDLQDAAGTDFDATEIGASAKLWGLLKANPELSDLVGKVIDQHLTSGRAQAPTDMSISSKEAELEMKEAILDLKMQDKVFNKHSDKILEWAANEGFDVNDGRALKLAYMAWKGSQGKIFEATKKFNEQKRQATKKTTQKKAAVHSGKSGKQKGKLDYTKMTANDLLASEGLSLFTEAKNNSEVFR